MIRLGRPQMTKEKQIALVGEIIESINLGLAPRTALAKKYRVSTASVGRVAFLYRVSRNPDFLPEIRDLAKDVIEDVRKGDMLIHSADRFFKDSIVVRYGLDPVPGVPRVNRTDHRLRILEGKQKVNWNLERDRVRGKRKAYAKAISHLEGMMHGLENISLDGAEPEEIRTWVEQLVAVRGRLTSHINAMRRILDGQEGIDSES